MIKSLCSFFLVFVLLSCASVPSMNRENQDKEALVSRINLYWNAKQNNDLKTVTELMDSEAKSSNTSAGLNKYANLTKISDFRIDQIDMIDKENATVVVTIQVALMIGKRNDNHTFEQVVTDKWFKKDGVWYVSKNKPGMDKIFEKYQERKNATPQFKPN